jgi:hypothetical protein
MSAYIVKLTAEESAVLKDVMSRAREGAILIHPEDDAKLKAAGLDVPDGDLVDYDFGGECDVMVDRLNGCSLDAILDHLGIADDEDPEFDGTVHEKYRQQILGDD